MDDPRFLTQFFFRQILQDGEDPCASNEIKRLWEEYGAHREDCAMALLELQSRLDLASQADVEAAAAALIAAAISAQGKDELDSQIQLSRTLEMIASKTPHSEARSTILTALRVHELLFDPALLMMPLAEFERQRELPGERDWLGFPAQETGSLVFVDELCTRKDGLVLSTRAHSHATDDSGGWTPSIGPYAVDAYGLQTGVQDGEEILVLLQRTQNRSVFLAGRARIHAIHRQVISAWEDQPGSPLLDLVRQFTSELPVESRPARPEA